MEYLALLGLIALITVALIAVTANIHILTEAIKRLWDRK